MNSNVTAARRGCLAISTAILLSCACVAAPASAGEQVRTETVTFRDLDVTGPEGVRVLFDRIHAAAKRVCSTSDPMLQVAAYICISKAEAGAVNKVNLPQLTAYYSSKHGDKPQPLIAAR